MIKIWAGTALTSLIVFLLLRLVLARFLSPETSLLVAGLFGGFILLVGSILVFRRRVTVMTDRKTKCPHCGKPIEAAFINEQLAMELECPHCGKQIREEHGVKPEDLK